MTRINILSCTDRPEANAWSVATDLNDHYSSEKVESNLFSLCDFPHADVVGGRYGDDIPSVTRFNEELLDCNGIVFVVPEYNGGFPGILKLFFDYLPFPKAIDHKPVAVVGEAAGYFGALRAVEHLQDLLIYRKAHLYPERVFLPRINAVLDDDGQISDESKTERLQKQARGFIRFVEKVAGGR